MFLGMTSVTSPFITFWLKYKFFGLQKVFNNIDQEKSMNKKFKGTAGKYRIAWLPGDGVGVDVMDATKLVLDRIKLNAEYIHGDIGWEFWCKEGDALPARTIELIKNVDAAMFGAITSKPVKASALELVPELKDKGLVYRSPIVRMRQLFDLYVCLRPIKSYPGNPLNYKEDINLVVFRENTEDLYAGIEFSPVPSSVSGVLEKEAKNFAPFKDLPGDQCTKPPWCVPPTVFSSILPGK
jgi:isocitrate dehydrogenase